MAGQTQKAKDSAMAARMKADGVARRTMRCPICHNLVTIGGLDGHFLKNCGKSR